MGKEEAQSWGEVTRTRAGRYSRMANLQTCAQDRGAEFTQHSPQGGQSEVVPRGWGLHAHSLTWRLEAFWLGVTCLRALGRPCGAGGQRSHLCYVCYCTIYPADASESGSLHPLAPEALRQERFQVCACSRSREH